MIRTAEERIAIPTEKEEKGQEAEMMCNNRAAGAKRHT